MSFNDQQLSSFIQDLKAQDKVEVVTAATIVGEQICKKVWLMGSELQLDEHGEPIPENNYKYMCFSYSHLTLSSQLPSIKLPLSSAVLHQLVTCLEVVISKTSIAPSLFCLEQSCNCIIQNCSV